MHPVAIETIPSRRFAALPRAGAHTGIAATFGRLGAAPDRHGLRPRVRGPMAAFRDDDPATVPVADLCAQAGVPLDAPVPDGRDAVVQAGGRVAVLTLHSPCTGIPAAWSRLHGARLPQAGAGPADAAPWEEYPNTPADTARADPITRVCVPLRG